MTQEYHAILPDQNGILFIERRSQRLGWYNSSSKPLFINEIKDKNLIKAFNPPSISMEEDPSIS